MYIQIYIVRFIWTIVPSSCVCMLFRQLCPSSSIISEVCHIKKLYMIILGGWTCPDYYCIEQGASWSINVSNALELGTQSHRGPCRHTNSRSRDWITPESAVLGLYLFTYLFYSLIVLSTAVPIMQHNGIFITTLLKCLWNKCIWIYIVYSGCIRIFLPTQLWTSVNLSHLFFFYYPKCLKQCLAHSKSVTC